MCQPTKFGHDLNLETYANKVGYVKALRKS